jgi:hypothetical protein
MRTLFDQLTYAFSKFYSPSKHLSGEEVTVLFKVRAIFKQYIPKKHKYFGIKTYRLCDLTEYTYNMRIYLGKNKQNSTQMKTVTHTTVRSLTRRVDGVGHKLYMDNFFSSSHLFHDLHTRGINCCGTVRQNCKGMQGSFDSETLKLKVG